jgi:membrane fusion protein, copper/silver efflux system
MNRVWLTGIGIVAVSSALWLVAGSRHQPLAATGLTDRAPLYYRDPMHPSFTSSRPGKAPDCGMDLEPVYAEGTHPLRGDAQPAASPLIDATREHQEMMGVRLGRVERARTAGTLRTQGRIALDEDRVFPLAAAGDGWITQILPGTTAGQTVRAGQPLVVVYGREYEAAQRAFLYALRASENPPPSFPGDSLDQTAQTLQESKRVLQNMGFGASQIEQLTKTRQVTLDVTLTAPSAGVIVSRTVFPGQRFDRGAELFRVADLSHLWVIADLFGDDDSHVKSGDVAQLSLANRSDISLRATVAEALPRFDGGSRTVKIRLGVANPELALRPEMFVNLEFPVSLPEALTIPSDAIVESGLRKTVFVSQGGGVFEPRAVETGWRFGGRVQILHGLSAGDSIVVSGTFLLDSASRMRRGDAGGHD